MTLDLCPSSNWQAGIVPSVAAHPLARLHRMGVPVTLSPYPNVGSHFTGWSGGGCSGTGTCTVTLTGANLAQRKWMMMIDVRESNDRARMLRLGFGDARLPGAVVEALQNVARVIAFVGHEIARVFRCRRKSNGGQVLFRC